MLTVFVKGLPSFRKVVSVGYSSKKNKKEVNRCNRKLMTNLPPSQFWKRCKNLKRTKVRKIVKYPCSHPCPYLLQTICVFKITHTHTPTQTNALSHFGSECIVKGILRKTHTQTGSLKIRKGHDGCPWLLYRYVANSVNYKQQKMDKNTYTHTYIHTQREEKNKNLKVLI